MHTARPILIALALLAQAAIVRPSSSASRVHAGSAVQDPSDEGSSLSVLRAELEAARAARVAGDHARARELVDAAIERALLELPESADAPAGELLEELGDLAQGSGHLRAAEQARRARLELLERTLPADHPDLQSARGDLAGTMYVLGDLAGARSLFEQVLAALDRTLPAEHPELQRARGNLAGVMHSLGDLSGARDLFAEVLEVFERTLPAEHPNLQTARGNLAGTMASLGDLGGARTLQEQVLAVLERTLPAEHQDLQAARGNLAETLVSLGDLIGARALQEQVLVVLERTLPAEHPHLQIARGNLAETMASLGDLAGARSLQEQVLAVLERTLPAEHPAVQTARGDLAGTMASLGDPSGARALQQQVLAVFEQTLPSDHPHVQRARASLAGTLVSLGDLSGARALQEQVLAVLERSLPVEHPNVQGARLNLAWTTYSLGDFAGARAPLEEVLALVERTLPPDHPDLLRARLNLALTLSRLVAERGREGAEDEGAWPRALACVAQAAGGCLQAVRVAISTAAAREAEERIGREVEWPLGFALSFGGGYGLFGTEASLVAEAFRLSEGTRAAALASVWLARVGVDPAERTRLREEIRAAGTELTDLVQRGASREDYHRARSRREAAERELVALARERGPQGLGVFEVGVESLAGVIEEGTALVGFRPYTRSWLEKVGGDEEHEDARFEDRSRSNLGAFVLRSMEGSPRLAFVDLGARSEVDEAVRVWRAAIGAGSAAQVRSGEGDASGSRGIGLSPGGAGSELAEAAALRRLVWDPLAEALGDARRVVVALDDVLNLVALDALPLDEAGELVGSRWRIETRLALWELLDRPPPSVQGGRLVVLGGAAFDAEPLGGGEDEDLEDDPAILLTPAESNARRESGPHAGDRPGTRPSLLRGSPFEVGFSALPFTRTEMLAIAAIHADAHPGAPRPRLLEGPRASRGELERRAPEARWLHVATHGWFAPESVRSWADPDEGRDHSAAGHALRAGGGETVRGMSPMLLCGLACAGANLPPDFLGRVPGLVTAEEIAALDLTGCELAVLSACDTNVGLMRAGQGVASLQKALHMAGARSVITSLWKVDDAATAKLFERFYARLWKEGLSKSEALWRTKLELRAEGHPVRDWAAWVLTGDPN